MASLYVYLVFIVCYLPNICVLIIIANISEPTIDLQHLQFYTLTLLFVNSTLNPCTNLLLEDERHAAHYCRHTTQSFFKSHLKKAPP